MGTKKSSQTKNNKFLDKLKQAITTQKEDQVQKKDAEKKKKQNEEQTKPKEAETRLEQKVEEEAKEDLLEITLPIISRRPAATIEEELGLGELRVGGEKKPELPEEQKQYVERTGGAVYASAAIAHNIQTYMLQTGMFGNTSQFTPQTLNNLAEPERRRVFEMASNWTGIAFEDYNRLQGAVQSIFSQTQQYISGQQALPHEREADEIKKYKGMAKT